MARGKLWNSEPHLLASAENEAEGPLLVRQVASDPVGRAAPEDDSHGMRSFRSLATGIRCILRAQASLDESVIATQDMILGIAVMLETPQAFRVAADSLFDQFSEREAPDQDLMLAVAKLPQVLDRCKIPERFMPMFSALVRKYASLEQWLLPEAINRENFKQVLLKGLRRVRDKYCSHRISRERFLKGQDGQRQLEDEYIVGDVCGKGSFGVCNWITHRMSKRKRVCKKLLKDSMQVPAEEVPAELDLLRHLDHPNILRVFEWFESTEAYELVFEAAHGGDLRHLLAQTRESENKPGFEEGFVRQIAAQTFRALAYMHGQNVIHRDVKPANMLLVSADLDSPRLLLADFGVADFFEDHERTDAVLKGTLAYMAPEVFTMEVSPRTDVWAAGVVMFELFSGKRPFKGDNPMSFYVNLKKGDVILDPVTEAGASQVALECIGKLLSKEVTSRPTASEALDDAWLKQVDVFSISGREARKAKQSILAYVNSSHFSKTAMNCMAAQLDSAAIERLTQIFESFDLDNDGKLSTSELVSGLVHVGIDEESAALVSDALDVNCNGYVDFSEFTACLLQTQSRLIEEVVYHAFHIFDANGDGRITLYELQLMLAGEGSLAAVLPDGKTPDQVLEEIDTSGDGRISLEEFKSYLCKEGKNTEGRAKENQGPDGFGSTSVPLFPLDSYGSANGAVSSSFLTQKEGTVTLGFDEPLEKIFRRWAVKLKRSEEDCASIATKLAKNHWITTLDDLMLLRPEDWARLDLPMKLECILRQHLEIATAQHPPPPLETVAPRQAGTAESCPAAAQAQLIFVPPPRISVGNGCAQPSPVPPPALSATAQAPCQALSPPLLAAASSASCPVSPWPCQRQVLSASAKSACQAPQPFLANPRGCCSGNPSPCQRLLPSASTNGSCQGQAVGAAYQPRTPALPAATYRPAGMGPSQPSAAPPFLQATQRLSSVAQTPSQALPVRALPAKTQV
mmetsp:Transcript_19497/g.42650  ORF Transcript_19497/g.42650 Transcript_19497/m.42650 type:complete len:971 (+) Transcript_19497:59-2971(+)